MKKFITILILVFTWTSLAAASRVYTTTQVNIRTSPTTQSRIVQELPKGAIVSVVNNFDNGWTLVLYDHIAGFIKTQYLRREYEVARPVGTVKYYTNSYGNRVQSPTFYDAPPRGATARCRDGSYSFSQNRSGTCSHHGGVERWL